MKPGWLSPLLVGVLVLATWQAGVPALNVSTAVLVPLPPSCRR